MRVHLQATCILRNSCRYFDCDSEHCSFVSWFHFINYSAIALQDCRCQRYKYKISRSLRAFFELQEPLQSSERTIIWKIMSQDQTVAYHKYSITSRRWPVQPLPTDRLSPLRMYHLWPHRSGPRAQNFKDFAISALSRWNLYCDLSRLTPWRLTCRWHRGLSCVGRVSIFPFGGCRSLFSGTFNYTCLNGFSSEIWEHAVQISREYAFDIKWKLLNVGQSFARQSIMLSLLFISVVSLALVSVSAQLEGAAWSQC